MHVKVSVEQALSIYQKLNYTITRKSGSHITITTPDGKFEYAMTLPHGAGKRFLTPFDVKRLKHALNNDIDALKRSIQT